MSDQEQPDRPEPEKFTVGRDSLPDMLTGNFDEMTDRFNKRRKELEESIAMQQAELRVVVMDLFVLSQCRAATKLTRPAADSGEVQGKRQSAATIAKSAAGRIGLRPGAGQEDYEEAIQQRLKEQGQNQQPESAGVQ